MLHGAQLIKYKTYFFQSTIQLCAISPSLRHAQGFFSSLLLNKEVTISRGKPIRRRHSGAVQTSVTTAWRSGGKLIRFFLNVFFFWKIVGIWITHGVFLFNVFSVPTNLATSKAILMDLVIVESQNFQIHDYRDFFQIIFLVWPPVA